MIRQLTNRNFYIVLASDVVLFALSLVLAYALRFSFRIPHPEQHQIAAILPWVIAVKGLTFFFMGAYRGMWRYTSLPDAWRLAQAAALATLVIMAGLTFVSRFEGYPRSVFLADSIFTLFFCGALRAGIRMAHTHRRPMQAVAGEDVSREVRQKHRLLIIGAGDAADKIIRETQDNHRSPYEVVCCVDDDARKHGRTLLGVPVHGPIERLPHFAKRFRAAELLIAMPSVSGERMRLVVAVCEKSGIPFKTLPSLTSLIDGRVTVNDLREVRFEDLLGRPPVRLNIDEVGQYLTGKTVAVTGAGGSIGSELCRQIARFKPGAVLLVEAHEFNLYRVEMELRAERRIASLYAALGRVQDHTLMTRIFKRHRPHVVFHAAAYKHVPMVETNPWEGVFNNVLGSQVLMDVAEEFGAERFVLVSTDKAVRPTNVMGASKRMAELLLQSRPPGATRFMAVRFGNVVGSSGSVIPLFQQQIKAGGPITLTHADMTRYFMTIPEASQLILQAGAMGEGGEIFILEMGTPVKIGDMARDLIRLSGKEPGRDIQIVEIGLRPGEKLHEELITHGEGIMPTPHEKIMVLKCDHGGMDPVLNHRRACEHVAALVSDAATYDAARIRARLQAVLPEYTPSSTTGVI